MSAIFNFSMLEKIRDTVKLIKGETLNDSFNFGGTEIEMIPDSYYLCLFQKTFTTACEFDKLTAVIDIDGNKIF